MIYLLALRLTVASFREIETDGFARSDLPPTTPSSSSGSIPDMSSASSRVGAVERSLPHDNFTASTIRPWLESLTVVLRPWDLSVGRANLTIGSSIPMLCTGFDLTDIKLHDDDDDGSVEQGLFTVSLSYLILQCTGSFNGTYHGRIFHPALIGEVYVVVDAIDFNIQMQVEAGGTPSLPRNVTAKKCGGNIKIDRLKFTPGDFAIEVIEMFHNVIRRHVQKNLPEKICSQLQESSLLSRIDERFRPYLLPTTALIDPSPRDVDAIVDIRKSPVVRSEWPLMSWMPH